MDRLINENAVLSAIGEWIAHNEYTYTNATEYLRNRIKAIKTAEQEPCEKLYRLITDSNSLMLLENYKTGERTVIEKRLEPCEDCISREEVCDYIAEFVNHEYATDRERELVKHIIGGIQHLPSIQPKPKTGYWILQPSNKEQGERDFIWWKCSECGQVIYSETEQDRQEYHAYCGRCGAKMLPTDSEKE